MLKVNLLTLAISTVLSFSPLVSANIHGANGIQHLANANPVASKDQTYIPNLIPALNKKSIQRMSRSSIISTKSSSTGDITPIECTTAEFAQYTGDDLIEYLSNAHTTGDNPDAMGYECFRVFFEDASNANTIFSPNNVDAVATSLVADLNAGATSSPSTGRFLSVNLSGFSLYSGNFSKVQE